MNLAATLRSADQFGATLGQGASAPFLLALRVYVAWQFLKSGWLKVSDWENTRFLFQEEYRVPLLPSDLAALVGTAGELVFPVLLILGLLTRPAAAGLSLVNVLAVVSYAHVLLTEGFEAAVGQHYLWGLMLLTLMVFGAGRWSADAQLLSRARNDASSPVDA
jgi:putative oxidoreductase